MYIIRFSKTIFLVYLKQVFLPDAFEDFMRRSVLDKTVFCSGEKQGMIANNDCSSWYNSVGDFLMSVWERGRETLYGKGSVYKIPQNDPILKYEANGNNCYGS